MNEFEEAVLGVFAFKTAFLDNCALKIWRIWNCNWHCFEAFVVDNWREGRRIGLFLGNRLVEILNVFLVEQFI